MTTWTTVAATKAALIDRLQASPTLAGIVLDGVPFKDEDVKGPRGDGMSVWIDNSEAETVIEPRALGPNGARIGQRYVLTVRVQCVAEDSGTGVRASEAQCAELVSAVMDVVYTDGDVIDIGDPSWTVRAQFERTVEQSGPMAHEGYSAQAMVDMRIEATRC